MFLNTTQSAPDLPGQLQLLTVQLYTLTVSKSWTNREDVVFGLMPLPGQGWRLWASEQRSLEKVGRLYVSIWAHDIKVETEA